MSRANKPSGAIWQDKIGVNLKEYAGYDYVVRWGQINSERDVLRFVSHLCHKTWATPRMIDLFILIACERVGFSVWPLSFEFKATIPIRSSARKSARRFRGRAPLEEK